MGTLDNKTSVLFFTLFYEYCQVVKYSLNNTSELVTVYRRTITCKMFSKQSSIPPSNCIGMVVRKFSNWTLYIIQFSDKRKFLLSSLHIVSEAATKRHQHTSHLLPFVAFCFESEGPLKSNLAKLLHDLQIMSISRDSYLNAADMGHIWNEANMTEPSKLVINFKFIFNLYFNFI